MIIAAILFSWLLIPNCSAQDIAIQSIAPDSLKTDSLAVAPDTAAIPPDLDSIVTYSAKRVAITFNPRQTILTGDAKVNYKSMELTAGRIEIDWDTNRLYAESLPDTIEHPRATRVQDDLLRVDSLAAESKSVFPDTIRLVGKPKMADGAQIIVGEKMTYDIKSRRGKVIEGDTDYDDGFYHGKTIKRMDASVYNIRSGYYTTCGDDEPHYGFWSRDMKMVVKDRVIARPVVLQFGPVPVAILPYGVFPTKGGRHSGILVPTYGESSNQGRYFTGLGYYWAPNDYFDAKGSLDYFERYGILFHGDMNYTLRYLYAGRVAGSFLNQTRNGIRQKRWDLSLNHSQTLSPSANLNVSGQFVSDKEVRRDFQQNTRDRLDKVLRSDATLNKFWPGTPYSASVNLNRVEYLESGNINQSIPRVTFSRNQTPIIIPPEGTKPDDARWWNQIYWSYGGSGLNTSVTNVNTLSDGGKQKISRDRSGVQHSLGLTASTKPFGIFAFTPGVRYTEGWFDEWIDYVERDDNRVDSLKHKSFRARRTFSTGAGLSTKLYGLFRPHVFGVEAIRHTLSPSVNLTYAPDFSDAQWGYYVKFRNPVGREVFYDRFAGNLFGTTPRQEQMVAGISVGNLFEYKRKIEQKEVKGELFSLGLSTSYNFKADSLKWSDLGGSINIKPLVHSSGSAVSGLGLDVTTRHSFYDQEEVSPERWVTVNRSADGGLRLLDYNLTTSLKIQGGQAKKDEKRAADTSGTISGAKDQPAAKFWRPNPIPWTAGIALHYGDSRINPAIISRNAWANINLDIQATKSWKINSDMRIDLIKENFASMGITLYRDLHCWEGRLTWRPVGVSSGYYLIISVKSPHLKDVKVEKREGVGGYIGPF